MSLNGGRVTNLLFDIIDKKTQERAAEIAASQNSAANTVVAGQMPGGFPVTEAAEEPVVPPVSETPAAPAQRPATLRASGSEVRPKAGQKQESGGFFGWFRTSRETAETASSPPKDSRKESPRKAQGAIENDIRNRNSTSAIARLNDGVDASALLKKYLHEKDFDSLLFAINHLSLIDTLRKVYAEVVVAPDNKVFQGSTLLHYAAMNNQPALTKAVIDAWVDLSPEELNLRNKAKKSALMIAHDSKSWPVVELLLARGAKDTELLSKLAANVFVTLEDTTNDPHTVISDIDWAKRFGFDINHQQNSAGDNVLHAAVKARGPIIISPLLQEEGIKVDAVNAHDETALLLAVMYDDADSTTLLLDAGAVDYRSPRETLLGVAVGNDSLATVNLLLARGMREDEALPSGRSALEIAEAMIEQNALENGEAIQRALYADSDRMADALNDAVEQKDIDAVKDLVEAGVPVMRLSDENMQRWMQHMDATERAERMAAWSQASSAEDHPDIVMMVEKIKRLQLMKSSHAKQKKDMVSALEILKKDIIAELEVEMKQVEKLGKDISDVHDSSPVLLAMQTSELLDQLMIGKDAAISDADFQKRQQAALKYYEDNIPDMPRKHKLWKALGVVLLAIAAFVLTGGLLFGITVAAPVVIPVAAMIGAAAGAGVFTSLISGGFFMRSPAMKRHAEAVAAKSEKFVDELPRAALTA